jgi:hypothetical protein
MKTIEEVKSQILKAVYQECAKFEYEKTPLFFELERMVLAAFSAGVEFAQQWISVEDELPEECGYENKDVLIKIIFNDNYGIDEQILIDKRYCPCERIGYVWNQFHYENEQKEEIVSWRPIEIM